MDHLEYLEMKNDYIENIVAHMQDSGGMFTHIALFGIKKDSENQKGIVHIPISSDFLESQKTKSIFFKEVVPKIAKKVKEEFDIYSSCFTSEAWVRKTDIDSDISELMDSPIKQEALIIIHVNDEEGIVSEMYDIERLGKKVNESGDLVDIVNLNYNEKFSKMDDSNISETPMISALKLFI